MMKFVALRVLIVLGAVGVLGGCGVTPPPTVGKAADVGLENFDTVDAAPNALYRGARKLPGGCSLTLDLADFRVTEQRYWRFAIEADTHAPHARIAELTEELRALLDRAVVRRLVSDVPLGVFLSGGIDSSIMALCARQHGPVQTFSIGFDDPKYDETRYAREVAKHLGTQHHEFRVTPDAAAELPKLALFAPIVQLV